MPDSNQPVYTGVSRHVRRYADACVVPAGGRTIYVSGTPGLTEDGKVPELFGDEVRQMFANIEAALAKAGATMSASGSGCLAQTTWPSLSAARHAVGARMPVRLESGASGGEQTSHVVERHVERDLHGSHVASGLSQQVAALQSGDEAGGESVGAGVGAEFSAVLHAAEPVSQQLFPSLERGRERLAGFVVVVGDFGGHGPENTAVGAVLGGVALDQRVAPADKAVE